MNEVIRYKAPKTGNAVAKSGGGVQWRILIVDKLAKRMVSACVKMHDINAERVTRKFPYFNNFFCFGCEMDFFDGGIYCYSC